MGRSSSTLGDRHKLTPKVRKRQSISQFKIDKELLARIVGLGGEKGQSFPLQIQRSCLGCPCPAWLQVYDALQGINSCISTLLPSLFEKKGQTGKLSKDSAQAQEKWNSVSLAPKVWTLRTSRDPAESTHTCWALHPSCLKSSGKKALDAN